jgi:NTP pyrophosphatase (non-canonical NTP hydrolase)
MQQDILELIKQLSLNDPKTLSQKTNKLFEEGGELARAVLPYENASGTLHRVIHKGNLLEEAVDSILVAISIAYSLGYDDDAISSVMKRKALYWAELQQNEANVDPDRIPFEIHVTVSVAPNLDMFKKDCASIGVKAVVLALHTTTDDVLRDVMTSEVVIGSTTAAFDAMQKTKAALEEIGYDVIRTKIEAAPWHPSAPTEANGLQHAFGTRNYFESHIEVTVLDAPESPVSLNKLKKCLENFDAHLSANFFKANDEAKTVMVTLRRYTGTLEKFKKVLETLKATISDGGFVYNKKDIVEYSIYDSNTDHDNVWMNV